MEKKPPITSPFDGNIPSKCGVYLMRDKEGTILYIGKAVDIKKRMKSYQSGREDSRLQIPFLLEKVATIDTFITFTEKEALILENTLIKKHKPKYNILLKDDKSYTCLAIHKDSDFPRISIERFPMKNQAPFILSQPYTSSLTAKTHFEIVRRVFHLRSCSDKEFFSRKRPCILHTIDKCSAPCTKKISKKEYKDLVHGAKIYITGDSTSVAAYLKEEISLASKNLLFEKAGNYHRMLLSLTKKHSVAVTSVENIDVLALLLRSGVCIIYKLIFRNKLLVDGIHFSFNNIASDRSSTLSAFILQHYETIEDKPTSIYISEDLPDKKDISSIIGIPLLFPKIGEKEKLVSLALENAKEILEREQSSDVDCETLLIELKEKLFLKKIPVVIECIDTSSLGGKDSVAAIVVFKNAHPDRSSYRNYHVEKSTYADDLFLMKEVILRRYSKLQDLPDLILIDGGKGQLGVLQEALKELNILDVEIRALTKEGGRHDKGLTKERVYIPKRVDPITFDRHCPLLFLLQNIRDEAHRRAISFHRKKTVKASRASVLDSIKGIGPKKKGLLLNAFGSVAGIKGALDEDILSIKGISLKDLQRVRSAFL